MPCGTVKKKTLPSSPVATISEIPPAAPSQGILQGPGAEPPSCTLASESDPGCSLEEGGAHLPEDAWAPQIHAQGMASPEALPGPPASASPHGTTRHELSFDTHVVTDSFTHSFIHCRAPALGTSPPVSDGDMTVSRVAGTLLWSFHPERGLPPADEALLSCLPLPSVSLVPSLSL